MHQRPVEHCGSFNSDDIHQLKKSFKRFENQKLQVNNEEEKQEHQPVSPPRRNRSNSLGSDGQSETSEIQCENINKIPSWKNFKRVCRKHLCGVDCNLLVAIPKSLDCRRTEAEQSEYTVEFLMEELVRLSSVPSATIENCVCKVARGYTLSENLTELLALIHSYHLTGKMINEPKILYANISDEASGVLTTIPFDNSEFSTHMNLKVVLGCEHMMYQPCLSGCSDFFLIGGLITIYYYLLYYIVVIIVTYKCFFMSIYL